MRIASIMGGAALTLVAAGGARAQAKPVTHLESGTVATAFARGAALLEVENYKVHASRREAAGMAEVHVRDTDIIYVLEGTATFVTAVPS